MALKLITAPATEPLTITEVKTHLRLDSGSLADDTASYQTIATASHATAATYALEGTAIDVLGYRVLVLLDAGLAGGTVDVKLQDRELSTDTWTDVTGGAFAQITTANDNATYELDYTGGKRYLRAVATVGSASSVFGVTIQTIQPYASDDIYLAALIVAAREYVENYLNRALITQNWELVLDKWPRRPYVELPKPPLQSVTSVIYKDTAGTETTLAAANYILDTDSFVGKLALAYGCTWPTDELYPVGGIRIRYVAGYGAASAVPQKFKQAMLLLIGEWYERRESISDNFVQEIPFTVKSLLAMDRVMSM